MSFPSFPRRRTAARAAVTLLAVIAAACSKDNPTSPIAPCPLDASIAREPGVRPTVETTHAPCAHRVRVNIPLYRIYDFNEDRAEVMGRMTAGDQNSYAVWSKTRGYRMLFVPAGVTTIFGVAINAPGTVVGYGTTSETSPLAGQPVAHLIVWDTVGTPTDYGVIGGDSVIQVRPREISDSGDIAGYLVTKSNRHYVFVRSRTGTVTIIPTPAGTQSEAVSVNSNGQVAGWYTTGSYAFGPYRPFVWSQSGGFVDIGVLPNPSDSTQSSLLPTAMNDNGTVVGIAYSYSSAHPTTRTTVGSFIYSPSTGLRDLAAIGGPLNPVDITNEGEVLGWATIDGTYQPVSWLEGRGMFPVRDITLPADDAGDVLAINSWNEVLDSFYENNVLQNVVWTWNPERWR